MSSHFRKRCLDRLGFLPTKEEVLELVDALLNSRLSSRFKHKKCKKQPTKPLEFWKIEFRGSACYVVFDAKRPSLVTLTLTPPDNQKQWARMFDLNQPMFSERGNK